MLTTRLSLLERLRRPDDESAWGRFVELYTPLMLNWAKRQGLQEADTADLIQDVMALLVRKFGEFEYDGAGRFRSWLRTVFLNKLRERLRKKSESTLADSGLFESIPATIEPADDAEDRRLLVKRGLELIRPEFSESVWSAFWEYAVVGRSPSEVAGQLGITTGTVYGSKSRVVSRLRLEIGFVPD